MQPDDFKIATFSEDNFDLEAHKKAANATVRFKALKVRIRRHVFIGKIILAVVSLSIFVFILYLLSTHMMAVIL